VTTEQSLEDSQPASSSRPDPLFKLLTKIEAEQLGLEAIETEFQYSTRADLVLSVPPGLALEGTLFDFFRSINVLEFKSEGDRFDLREYIRNDVRTGLSLLQGQDTNFDNTLNLMVVARKPRSFLNAAKKRGLIFRREKGRPWLWQGKVGFQDVAIVVCRDLPLEPIYYSWLVFAPSDSSKWKEYIEILVREGRIGLLEVVQKLRPRELYAMLKYKGRDLEELARVEGWVPPIDDPEVEELQVEVINMMLQNLVAKKSKKVGLIVSKLKPEERLSGLKPEERLSGLKPEERAELLKLLTEQTKIE